LGVAEGERGLRVKGARELEGGGGGDKGARDGVVEVSRSFAVRGED